MTQTAQTYGESLYELARDEHLGEEILRQMQEVSNLLRENPQYVTLLSLPSIPKKERCDTVDESFRQQIHPYLLNFMKILTENGTISQFDGCRQAYQRRYNQDNGIVEVVAVSAVPLTGEAQEKLRARLAERTGKTVLLTNRVEPEILGGIRLEMDGKRLDGSVRNRLDDLQSVLRNMVL